MLMRSRTIQMIIIRMAIKATTPPTMPMIRVSSFVMMGVFLRGAFVLIFMCGVCVGSILQMIIGVSSVVVVVVVVVGLVSNLDDDFNILVVLDLAVVLLILRVSQVNSPSPISVSFFPAKYAGVWQRAPPICIFESHNLKARALQSQWRGLVSSPFNSKYPRRSSNEFRNCV